jgi:hypothetical protein
VKDAARIYRVIVTDDHGSLLHRAFGGYGKDGAVAR